ncbi:hypothetical protein Leryth_011111, partial [Lithospermum erythrorhizon]
FLGKYTFICKKHFTSKLIKIQIETHFNYKHKTFQQYQTIPKAT